MVVEFDEDRGLGTVRDEMGRELPFHCTAIADGTRRIGAGTPVSFLIVPGHLGRMEARGLVALGAGVPPPGPDSPEAELIAAPQTVAGREPAAVPQPAGWPEPTDAVPVERNDDTLTVYLGSVAGPPGDDGDSTPIPSA